MDVVFEHLLLRLRPLHRALRAAVDWRAEVSGRTVAPSVPATSSPLCVSDDDARLLCDYLDDRLRGRDEPALDSGEPLCALTATERSLETLLRAQAGERGQRLPIDALASDLGLDELELDSLLLAVAPELDRGYELLYGYLVDDLDRRAASVELVCAAHGLGVRALARVYRALGPAGKLVRLGLLSDLGEPITERHRVLRPSRAAVAFLMTGAGAPTALFSDPAEVTPAARDQAPGGVDADQLDAVAAAVRRGQVDLIGVWGPLGSAREDTVRVLAARAERPLRRLLDAELAAAVARGEGAGPIERSFDLARALGAMLWVDTAAILGPGGDQVRARLVAAALASEVPLCMSGVHPYRPVSLLTGRAYAELTPRAPSVVERAQVWQAALPTILPDQAQALAARFRLAPDQVRAAVRVAEIRAACASNGASHDPAAHIGDGVGAVTRSQSTRFTTVIEPRRGPDDLVLPPGLHASVMEVASFARAQPRVHDDWGMGRVLTGGGGIKALFTGDSGTGKTLAAEVIAGVLGLPLLRVDLARVVSKWVGETEQNLEVAFGEAEASHAVLFFDEADALFGKRGQVQRGTDRYANLEVSYLLQRLEDYAGVAVLATNLRDNVDQAFTRRFQIVVHFPRPSADERRRIWRIAFPATAPLSDDVALDALSKLDMTGASIVNAAQTAALLAAERGREQIAMHDVVHAVARQFQREARILTTRDLGPYAALLDP
ncbi:AAA family ATPase [Haliangium sp.]|uniref:AAA family ATPase n=1 Tax=Haliangium sp. TaxID=2663208 RepID=UPI003D1386D7